MIIDVNGVSEILNIPISTAYKVIAQLNAELKEQGYMTIRGKVQKEYLKKRFGFEVIEDEQ